MKDHILDLHKDWTPSASHPPESPGGLRLKTAKQAKDKATARPLHIPTLVRKKLSPALSDEQTLADDVDMFDDLSADDLAAFELLQANAMVMAAAPSEAPPVNSLAMIPDEDEHVMAVVIDVVEGGSDAGTIDEDENGSEVGTGDIEDEPQPEVISVARCFVSRTPDAVPLTSPVRWSRTWARWKRPFRIQWTL